MRPLPFLPLLLVFSLVFCTPAFAGTKKTILAPKTPQQERAFDQLVQGNNLLKEKKYFQARPILEKAALNWPTCAVIHYDLGRCYEGMGQFAKAVKEFEFALHLDGKMSDCFASIGSCYQLMGRPLDAVAWFESYLKTHPNGEDAAMVKGMIQALHRQANRQVDSDPDAPDYLASITPSGRKRRWKPDRMPLKIYISNGRDEAGRAVNGFRESYNLILLESLNLWVKASNHKVGYTLVTDPFQADIVCTWTDRQDFLKSEGTKVEQGVAHVATRIFRDNPEEEIGHVRVIILVLDHHGKQPISDEEMKKACLHELGHSLGFSGHSPNNKDVMFFSDSPTVWAALTKRDKQTLARLYEDYQELAQPYGWTKNPPVAAAADQGEFSSTPLQNPAYAGIPQNMPAMPYMQSTPYAQTAPYMQSQQYPQTMPQNLPPQNNY